MNLEWTEYLRRHVNLGADEDGRVKVTIFDAALDAICKRMQKPYANNVTHNNDLLRHACIKSLEAYDEFSHIFISFSRPRLYRS